jgi:hypothetical protein
VTAQRCTNDEFDNVQQVRGALDRDELRAGDARGDLTHHRRRRGGVLRTATPTLPYLLGLARWAPVARTR